jgi:hypothetical protein
VTTMSSTSLEKTPNVPTQSPVATKEVATDTPVAAAPTPRVTTAGNEATKTPQP